MAITFGISKIKIGLNSNFIIAIVSGAGTFISMTAGQAVSKLIPHYYSNIIGSSILIAIGMWFIKDYFFKKTVTENKPHKRSFSDFNELLSDPEKADADHSGSIDLKDLSYLP